MVSNKNRKHLNDPTNPSSMAPSRKIQRKNLMVSKKKRKHLAKKDG